MPTSSDREADLAAADALKAQADALIAEQAAEDANS